MPRRRIPVAALPLGVSPETYAAAVESQREAARTATEKLEVGESLDAHERLMASVALRAWADSIPSAPPSRPGTPSRIDPINAALRYAVLRRAGASHTDAIAEVAGFYEAEDSTIRAIINGYGPSACRLLGVVFWADG